MMRFFIGLLILRLAANLGSCQIPDSLLPPPAEACTHSRAYIPWNANHWPVKRVRLVVHILQNPDTMVNFVADSAAHWRYLRILFKDVNRYYANPEPPRTPVGSPHVGQGRIQFVYDTTLVFFHNLPGIDYFNPRSVQLQHNKADSLYRVLVENNPNMPYRENALHVFMGDRRDGSCTGMAQSIGSGKWLLVMNLFHFYRQGGNFWMPSGLVRHEFGHNLGLLHPCAMDRSTTIDDHCGDTHPPTSPNPCCWNGASCSNNMMDYNADKRNLSAEQLGRCHAYLTGAMRGGTIHRTVIPDWETYHAADSVVILPTDTAIWRGTRRLLGDVIVRPGAVWRVGCNVTLPPGAVVRLGPGARVELARFASLESGNATQPWQGFVLEEKPRTAQKRKWLILGQGAEVRQNAQPPRAYWRGRYTVVVPTE